MFCLILESQPKPTKCINAHILIHVDSLIWFTHNTGKQANKQKMRLQRD